MKVIVGADHRGVQGAQDVMSFLRSAGHEVEYVGPENAQARADYTDQAYVVGQAVAEGRAQRGILVSGTGIGTSITANKFKGVRAVVGYDEWNAEIGRAHHDTNVLCVPADMVGAAYIRKIVEKWMGTEFEGGRHARRVRKIELVESGQDPRGYKGD